MARLSISKAWVETRDVFAREGRLLVSVALALIAFPTMIVTLIAPNSTSMGQSDPWPMQILQFVFMILALAGQMALVRLALRPSITVGAAIGHAFQRVPVYVAAMFLVALGVIALLVPIAMLARLGGVPIDADPANLSGTAALIVLLLIVLFLALVVRIIMSTAVASLEHGGPLHVIARSWALTRKNWGRLFAFVLVILLSALVLMMIIQLVVLSVIKLSLGEADPMTISALLVGIIEGVFNAAFTALFSVMLARLYVQLAERDSADAPISGS